MHLISTKKLTITAVTYLLLVLITAYFKYFPTFISPEISNIFIVLSIFLIIILLVYEILLISVLADIYFVLPQSMIFIFIVRAIPHLRLSYPPLHDPYYYFVVTLNIIQYGTLTPILGWWYPFTGRQLHWPALHILTATATFVTNINPMFFARFLNPILGLLFYYGVYLIAKEITNDNKFALLAAFLSSLIDVVIFYQSEYHPQGIALTIFLFFFYALIKFGKKSNTTHLLFVGVFMILLLIVHHFTSISLVLLLSGYVIFLFICGRLFKEMKISSLINIYKTDILIVAIYSLIAIFYNIYYTHEISIFYKDEMGRLLSSSVFYSLLFGLFAVSALLILSRERKLLKKLLTSRSGAASLITLLVLGLIYHRIHYTTDFLSIYKVFLFTMAFIYLIKVGIWNTTEHRPISFFLSAISFGAVGFYLFPDFPTDRVIAFSMPFMVIFSLMILYPFIKNLKNLNMVTVNKKSLLTLLFISSLLTISFFNSQLPAHFFKDSESNTSYWYCNDLSSINRYGSVGGWSKKYTPKSSNYGIEFDTRILPFYYSQRPYRNIHQLTNFIANDPSTMNYYIVNPTLPYRYPINFSKTEYIVNQNTIYCDGVLLVGLPNRYK